MTIYAASLPCHLSNGTIYTRFLLIDAIDKTEANSLACLYGAIQNDIARIVMDSFAYKEERLVEAAKRERSLKAELKCVTSINPDDFGSDWPLTEDGTKDNPFGPTLREITSDSPIFDGSQRALIRAKSWNGSLASYLIDTYFPKALSSRYFWRI